MTVAEPTQLITQTGATDAALLAAVARGDATGLATLARRYGGFIHAAALRQTGDPATADDVTQAVLIVLSQKAGHIAARALPSWLHQTTRYAAANANRAAKRRRLHERRAARPEGRMDPTPDEINPLLVLLDDAIAKLADADRRAVVGRFLLGQDAATVAITLGVSPRAAQKRIERAVERLRERLIAAQRSAAGTPALATGTATASGAPASSRTASTNSIAAGPHSPAAGGRVSLKAIAITPAVVAAVLSAAAPSPASAAVVAVPTVAAVSLAKQTATWMTIAKVKAAMLAIVPAAVVTGAVGAVAVVTLTPATKPAASVNQVTQVAPAQQADARLNTTPSATRGTLRSGGWIEYLGVAEAETPRVVATWSGPDGKPMPTPPLFYRSDWNRTAVAGEVVGRFAFAVDPNTMGIGRQGDPKYSTVFRLDENSLFPAGRIEGNRFAQATEGAPRFDRFMVDFRAKPGIPMSLKFNIAAGPWVPRLESRPDADLTIVAQDDVVSAFLGQPFEDTGKATIWYRQAQFYSRPDTRLVAIDTDGNSHNAEQEDYRYRSPQQLAAEPMLAKTFPEMRMNRVRLADAISFLETTLNCSIVVDWDALKAQNQVTRESLVNMRQGAWPLYLAMPVFLAAIEHRGELDFDVKDGVITMRPMDREENKRRPTAFSVPGVPLNRLDHFEVQTRNFDQWISFENLTAELGKPANLVIRTSDDAPAQQQAANADALHGIAAVTLANGSRVQLVAIGDAKTGECWRPDGTACAIPFGYRPQDEYPAGPGKRRIWAMTVTHDAASTPGMARSYLLNREGTGDAPGGFSATYGTAPDGTVYQVCELLIDDTQQTVDWAVGVASKPARKVSIERGPDGWAANVLGKLVLETGEAAYVWGPQTEAIQRGNKAPPPKPWEATHLTRWQVWTPNRFGRRHELRMDYINQTGNSPNGSMLGYADAGGFHIAQCQEQLDNLQRVTMSITQFDLAAVFRNVSLWPGKQSAVGATAEQLEQLPGR